MKIFWKLLKRVSDNGGKPSYGFMSAGFRYGDKIITDIVIACIFFYQKTFSPDHGMLYAVSKRRHCRFYPSCSAYAIQALRQYRLSKGLMVSMARILRCNPMSRGGYDPITY